MINAAREARRQRQAAALLRDALIRGDVVAMMVRPGHEYLVVYLGEPL
jgi:acyl-CoA synthetase (AMP-forming)/AMP-acid ligase II